MNLEQQRNAISEDLTYARQLIKVQGLFGEAITVSSRFYVVWNSSTGCYVLVNPAFRKALGYRQAELYARPITDFIHPDDITPTKQIMASMVDGDTYRFRSFQNRYQTADGRLIRIEWMDAVKLNGGDLWFANARPV